jgi:hypothetical protein
LPEDDGQICGHHVFSRPSGLGGSRIDGQPASRVLLRFVLVDVGDLEVWGPLDGPETWSKRGYSTCVFLPSFMVSVPGRGVGVVPSRPSPNRAAGRGCCRLNSGGVTSSRDAVVPIVLLPASYLVFVSSVARSIDGAPRVSRAVDGVSQIARGMSEG